MADTSIQNTNENSIKRQLSESTKTGIRLPHENEVNAKNSGSPSPIQPKQQQSLLSNNELIQCSITTKKRRKKRFVFAIMLTILMFVLTTFIYGFVYFKDLAEESEKNERDLYEKIKKDNYNITLFQTYLQNFPQGAQYGKIKVRLSQLQNMEAAWKQIEHSNNINNFIDFKNTFRDNRYAQLCNEKIDSLDWIKAMKQHTPEAYQRYIICHSNGKYVDRAKESEEMVAYMNVSEQQEEKIRQVTFRLINAINENDDIRVSMCVAPKVEYFMDLKDVDITDILVWLSEKYRQHTFVNYSLQKQFQIRKDLTENNEEIYTNECRIEEMTTNEAGRAHTTIYDATIRYNRNYQIFSLEIKEK